MCIIVHGVCKSLSFSLVDFGFTNSSAPFLPQDLQGLGLQLWNRQGSWNIVNALQYQKSC